MSPVTRATFCIQPGSSRFSDSADSRRSDQSDESHEQFLQLRIGRDCQGQQIQIRDTHVEDSKESANLARSEQCINGFLVHTVHPSLDVPSKYWEDTFSLAICSAVIGAILDNIRLGRYATRALKVNKCFRNELARQFTSFSRNFNGTEGARFICTICSNIFVDEVRLTIYTFVTKVEQTSYTTLRVLSVTAKSRQGII